MSDTANRNFSIHRKTYTHKSYIPVIPTKKSQNEIACKCQTLCIVTFPFTENLYTQIVSNTYIEKSDNEIACKYVSHSKQLLFHSKKKNYTF